MYRRRGSGSLPQTGLTVVEAAVDPGDDTVVCWLFSGPYDDTDPDTGAWGDLVVGGESALSIISNDALDGQICLQYASSKEPGVTLWTLAAQPAGTSTPLRVPQTGLVS